MTPDAASSHCAALVKQRDPVRYVTALFAPVVQRRFLFGLYALDAELARVRDGAREPMIAAIRFQWWRDALSALPGDTRGHPILTELAEAIRFGSLAVPPLAELVDARETGEEPALAEVALVTLAARMLGAAPGPNRLAQLAGVAIATGSRELLAEARRLWRGERRARRAELPAYLPATFVDARHPVTPFALHWRALRRGLAGRF